MLAWDESDKRRAKAAKKKRLEEAKITTDAIHKDIAKKRAAAEGEEDSVGERSDSMLLKAHTMWGAGADDDDKPEAEANEWDDDEIDVDETDVDDSEVDVDDHLPTAHDTVDLKVERALENEENVPTTSDKIGSKQKRGHQLPVPPASEVQRTRKIRQMPRPPPKTTHVGVRDGIPHIIPSAAVLRAPSLKRPKAHRHRTLPSVAEKLPAPPPVTGEGALQTPAPTPTTQEPQNDGWL